MNLPRNLSNFPKTYHHDDVATLKKIVNAKVHAFIFTHNRLGIGVKIVIVQILIISEP